MIINELKKCMDKDTFSPMIVATIALSLETLQDSIGIPEEHLYAILGKGLMDDIKRHAAMDYFKELEFQQCDCTEIE